MANSSLLCMYIVATDKPITEFIILQKKRCLHYRISFWYIGLFEIVYLFQTFPILHGQTYTHSFNQFQKKNTEFLSVC